MGVRQHGRMSADVILSFRKTALPRSTVLTHRYSSNDSLQIDLDRGVCWYHSSSKNHSSPEGTKVVCVTKDLGNGCDPRPQRVSWYPLRDRVRRPSGAPYADCYFQSSISSPAVDAVWRENKKYVVRWYCYGRDRRRKLRCVVDTPWQLQNNFDGSVRTAHSKVFQRLWFLG